MIDHSLLPAGLSAFGTAILAAIILGGYLVAGEPFVGLTLHRTFERAARTEGDARSWLYRRILLLKWALVAFCAATLIVGGGIGASGVGIRLPQGVLGWLLTLAAVVVGLGALAFTARAAAGLRHRPAREVAQALGAPSVVAMMPRTYRERRLFVAVAWTAGIAEEFVYRGFLLALIAALAPGFPVAVDGVIVAVAFGLAHVYQGPQGVVLTMVVGLVLVALYILSGSLLAPVLLHALIDLRAIALGRALAARPSRHRKDRR